MPIVLLAARVHGDVMEAATKGVHHVGLTVPDLRPAQDFFVDVLGFQVIGGKPEYPAVFVSDGKVMLTLWQVRDPSHMREFDRHNSIGLHHLALSVTDEGALHVLCDRLRGADAVELEFAPEPLGDSAIKHMMCSIPGGIRVEFIAAEP